VIVFAGHINQALDLAILQRNADRVAFIAVFFPVIEVFEDLRFDQVGDTAAYSPCRRDQGDNPAG
jgi:hypothetical protein